jgi:hypothetical protein
MRHNVESKVEATILSAAVPHTESFISFDSLAQIPATEIPSMLLSAQARLS